MQTFIQRIHKHLIIAGFATLAFATMAWIADGYTNPSTTNAAESMVDVSVSVTPYPTVVASEDNAWFLLYYKTRWGGTAQGIEVEATLPASMTLVSSYPANYSKQWNVYTWTNLPNNYGPIVLEVNVQWAEWTNHTMEAKVSTTSNDTNAANNQAEGTITILNTQSSTFSSNMEVSLSSTQNTVTPGTTIPYTIQYKNNGPDLAEESVIIVTIPNELTYVSGSLALDLMSTTKSLVRKISDLPSDGQGQIQLNLLLSNIVDAGDAVFSYVTISSTSNDTTPSNNQAYKSIVVWWSTSQPTTPTSQPSSPSAAGWAGWWAGDAESIVVPQEEQSIVEDTNVIDEEELPASSGFLFTYTQDNSLTVPASNTCASSIELQAAYTFAYGNSITTMDSLAQARMCDGVTRSELAKMISNYAINVLGKTPDTSIDCAFNDMDGQPEDLQQAAITACQLGLMGLDDGNPAVSFNPKQTVTRAIFGTAFSRLLYGDDHNDAWSNWYEAHLEALFVDGIIKNTTPTLQELRWYIMIMMQRSAK